MKSDEEKSAGLDDAEGQKGAHFLFLVIFGNTQTDRDDFGIGKWLSIIYSIYMKQK